MGAGEPVGLNTWKNALSTTPREAFNWRLFYGVLTFGMMGAARGLDEGLASGTVVQKSFIAQYHLAGSNISAADAAQKTGNITSMVQIGSAAGALIAFIVADRFGRLWSTRQLTILWIIGCIIYITSNGNYGQVLAGRFVMGLGIGQTAVIAPAYLSEIAPRAIRGLCVCCFAGSVYLGIMLGYFANWGTSMDISDNSQFQWIDPTIMHIIFAGLIFILSWFAIESPRYLSKVGKHEQAAINMSKIRGLPVEHTYVQAELIDIRDQIEREKEATHGSGWFGYIKEIFVIPSNRYRAMIGIMAQLLGQWSGANSMTIYAPQFFAMLGTTGQSEKLFATAIFGVVKLVSSLICAFFLVDFIGRKRALISGITIQFISMLYIAIYLTSVPSITTSSTPNLSGAAANAGTGAIVFIYFSGVGWALGWNSVQYLIGAEIFPLRIRALANSFIMFLHFVNQYGNTKAVPLMLLATKSGGITPQGTFWFFSAITLIGLAWVWFFLPETAGRSLEGMDELFSLPWYIIGRKGAELTKGKGAISETIGAGGMEKLELAEHAEHAEERA